MLTEAISALRTDFGDSVSPGGAPPALPSSRVCWEDVAKPRWCRHQGVLCAQSGALLGALPGDQACCWDLDLSL